MEERISSFGGQGSSRKGEEGRPRRLVQDEPAGEEDPEAVQKWLTVVNLSNENNRKVQREDPVIGYFLALKRRGS